MSLRARSDPSATAAMAMLEPSALSGRMNRWAGAVLAALTAIAALSPATATAATAHARARHACCRVAAGTPVQVALVDQVGSAAQKRGDTFTLRLAAPLIVDGEVVLRAGAPGVGEVIEAMRPSIGGKPAEMVLAADYLTTRHGRVTLDGLQLARPGHDNSTASQVLGISGLAFAPLGIVGIVVPGGDVVFKPGTVATAKVATAVTLPRLGRASRREIAAAAALASDHAALDAAGSIAIPPPPAGQGQVVFFRPKSLLGTGQWFNVREAGKALGRLSNGAYFILATNPGVHTYTAKFEPELKDHLKLDIAAGETYYVEGSLTGGLVIGAADLSPSDRGRFNKAAKDLKLAAAPTDDTSATPPPSAATDAAGPTAVDAASDGSQSAGSAAASDAPPPSPR